MLKTFTSLRTKPKILLGICVPLLFMLVLGAVSYVNIGYIVSVNQSVNHTHEVLEEAQGIVGSAVDMETGMRGYLLAGKEAFLEPYKAGSSAAYKAIEDLQQKVNDNPGQVARLEEVAETLKTWQTQIAEAAIEQRRQVGDTKTMDDMVDLVGAARGKTFFDKFRSLMAAFEAEERALMKQRKDENVATVNRTKTLILACMIIALVLGIGLALMIGSGIAGPIQRMTSAMQRLAGGDTQVEVPGRGRRDEIGAMAEAVQVFKENAIEKMQMEAAQVESARQAEKEKRQTMNALADGFERSVSSVVDGVSSAAEEMSNTSQSMADQANNAQTRATSVATAAEQATVNVQTVASASEELLASIQEISRQVVHANQIANKAVSEAERTNAIVVGLNDAAQKIGDVVKMINDIADQTNLLALNATIEAARAGDAGKGFAVVAGEVKSLASQTSKATDEIAQQINSVQTETTNAVTAIDQIRDIIDELNQISTAIASAMEEQSVTTQEITRNIEQAREGTEDVSRSIGVVSTAAQQTGSSAQEVLGAAKGLARQAASLRHEVDRFVTEVRTN